MRFLLLALPLMLAGCGSDEPADNAANVAAPAPRKGPMLGTVDLSAPVRASGTAPVWVLDVAPGRIVFRESDKPGATLTDFYPVAPQIDAEHAMFPTQTPEGVPVTITLTRMPCTAKGASTADPLTAELKIGTRVRTGCARPTTIREIQDTPGNSSAGG